MTTDFSQLLRATGKELHYGNTYYKGKGKEWLHHAKEVAVHLPLRLRRRHRGGG